MNVFHIRIVEDSNQITHHMLQALYEHLSATQGNLNEINNLAKESAYSSSYYGGVKGNAITLATNANADEDLVNMIKEVFVTDQEEGVSINEAIQKLQSSGIPISFARIKEHVEIMTNDGLIFSTIDEEHFRASS